MYHFLCGKHKCNDWVVLHTTSSIDYQPQAFDMDLSDSLWCHLATIAGVLLNSYKKLDYKTNITMKSLLQILTTRSRRAAVTSGSCPDVLPSTESIIYMDVIMFLFISTLNKNVTLHVCIKFPNDKESFKKTKFCKLTTLHY